MTKTIPISINGKTVHMEKDWTVLQACEKVGLFIPRFCYSESLSIAGNCRMCLVEIEKSPKLMPSCAIKINPGIKIYTKTNLVKKTRENILEFLLINHPLDCPVCDQAGECDLQDQAMIYGSDRGRFKEYKRAVQDKNAGPLIKTIMTRCIHCTRCIRFATEIGGIESLGTTGRGKSMEVGSYISKLFTSELSGNVIDLCPVGALTSKPYAFTVRPWELKSVESIDILDSVGSNIRIDIKGTDLMRILPRSNDLINQQWISDKTRFSYDGLKVQRLHYPMVLTKSWSKKKKKSNVQSWKTNLTKITKVLGRNSSKFLSSGAVIGPLVDQETILSVKNLMNKIGSDNTFIQDPTGFLNHKNVNYDFRNNYLMNWKDKAKSDFFLLVNTNPRFEASTFNIKLRKLNIDSMNSANFLTIGQPLDLTYPTTHLGTTSKDLLSFVQGKSIWSKKFILSKNPFSILGSSCFERKDGNGLHSLIILLTEKFKRIKKVLNHEYSSSVNTNKKYSNLLLRKDFRRVKSLRLSFNFKQYTNLNNLVSTLQPYASYSGAFDLGFYPGKRSILFNKGQFDTLFLIGADQIKNYGDKKSVLIYQGHHGDVGAKHSDFILPSTSFVEKKSTYINFEGLVQQTDTIGLMQVQSKSNFLSVQNQAQDDWKITHAIHKKLSENFVKKKRSLTKLFHFISPFLNEIDNQEVLISNQSTLGNNQFIPSCFQIKESNLIPLFDNYYQTDSITKSSITMAKSSSTFKNQKWPF